MQINQEKINASSRGVYWIFPLVGDCFEDITLGGNQLMVEGDKLR